MAFHLWTISEVYSNADGSVQFIELFTTASGETQIAGHTISFTPTGGSAVNFVVPDNLTSTTANKSLLFATQGFAALGIVTPDYIIPDGFLSATGGTLNVFNVDMLTLSSLPTDGTNSLTDTNPQQNVSNLVAGINSPTNFAGNVGTVPGNVISGTDGPDSRMGTAGIDLIFGGAGNDTLTGGAGNDTIDGGAGVDTAVYSNASAGYTVTKTASGRTVSGAEGSDTLTNIERLQFSDQSLALDMTVSEAGGKSALLLGACLGKDGLNDQATVGEVLDFFDGGYTLTDAATLLVGAGVVAQLAGGADNQHFVDWVFFNVVEVLPDPSTEAVLISFITSGQYTQATFLATVAGLQINQDHIGLVGLQDNGMEFA